MELNDALRIVIEDTLSKDVIFEAMEIISKYTADEQANKYKFNYSEKIDLEFKLMNKLSRNRIAKRSWNNSVKNRDIEIQEKFNKL